jgi:integrase
MISRRWPHPKQAKLVNKPQLTRLLDHVSHSRYPERDRVILLLSFKAGLRAKEIAGLIWAMITDACRKLRRRPIGAKSSKNHIVRLYSNALQKRDRSLTVCKQVFGNTFPWSFL